jgi:ABC-type multidrug transport system ATPase subunit
MGVQLTDTSPAIQTSELTKHYGPVLAVDHLTLTVNRGEVFGFLGPNGAGKSTTMRMFLGLARPTSGHVRILGVDIRTHLREPITRRPSPVRAEERRAYRDSPRQNSGYT